jgi:hypothetical protein
MYASPIRLRLECLDAAVVIGHMRTAVFSRRTSALQHFTICFPRIRWRSELHLEKDENCRAGKIRIRSGGWGSAGEPKLHCVFGIGPVVSCGSDDYFKVRFCESYSAPAGDPSRLPESKKQGFCVF